MPYQNILRRHRRARQIERVRYNRDLDDAALSTAIEEKRAGTGERREGTEVWEWRAAR